MMNQAIAELLRCPICGQPFTFTTTEPVSSSTGQTAERVVTRSVLDGQLQCEHDHVFGVTDGVPRLLPEHADLGDGKRATATQAIQDTYDAMWNRFEPGDREWANDLDDRVESFLPETRMTPETLTGKRVLDAGCGTGSLTQAITRFGCDSIGLDVSESVVAAQRRLSEDEAAKTTYVQGDLVHHPFADETFDIVYAGGVLHLNPDPEQAFHAICRVLKPGGTMFIWVYRKQPGRRHKLQVSFRAALSRLPHRLRLLIVLAWSPIVMLRQFVRNRGQGQLLWREQVVLLLDHYTPQYRWELETEEVEGWFEAAGFDDLKITLDGLGFSATAVKR